MNPEGSPGSLRTLATGHSANDSECNPTHSGPLCSSFGKSKDVQGLGLSLGGLGGLEFGGLRA